MTALQLLQYVTDALFVIVAAATIRRATLRHTPANVDVAAFFAILAVAVLDSLARQALGVSETPLESEGIAAIVMLLPVLLLRLADDFAGVPRRILRASYAGAALAIALIVVAGVPLPGAATLYLGAFFVVVSAYSAIRFILRSRQVRGVTRRRMAAVAWGTYLLAAAIGVAVVGALEPALATAGAIVTQALTAFCAIAYYLGFAPPTFLRRAWQEPELRAFLSRAAQLPRLETTAHIVRAIEDGTGSAIGARASLGLFVETEGLLRFARPDGGTADVRPGPTIPAQVFDAQRTLFVPDAVAADPENAERYRAGGMRVAIGAPVTAGAKRLGVLIAYAEHAPVFAQDDMEVVTLLADQAAVVLESRALIDEAARIRAQEQATRLKEDFLSAAAHDLRTPLTTIIGQAQALERRARRDPSLGGELAGIQRLVRESLRLRELVAELLDASRLERGALVGTLEPTELGPLVDDAARHRAGEERVVHVDAEAGLVALCDRRRVEQVIENLVENAVKFSPAETPVEVRAWRENGEARILVADLGIGIPPQDLPHVFDRFRRGSNVDDRRFAGMGLGLYICRGIVEQHGGRIWVESRVGEGATFHVALPLATIAQRAEVLN